MHWGSRVAVTGTVFFEGAANRPPYFGIFCLSSYTTAKTFFCRLKSRSFTGLKIHHWVSCVFISEDYRGRRISGALSDHANRYLKENGFDKSYGSTAQFDKKTQPGFFVPIQSLENGGILDVFPIFQTEGVGQKDG